MSQVQKAEFQDLLKENEQLFSWITADILHGLWFCDVTKQESLYLSDAFLQTLGYNPENYDTARSENNDAFLETIKQVVSKYTTDFNEIITFQNAESEIIALHAFGKFLTTPIGNKLVIKFKKEEEIYKDNLLQKIEERKKLNKIYESTNQIARIGGWEVDMIEGKIIWTSVVKEIHEVDQEFNPTIEEGISFFKEGWSRDSIVKIYNDSVESGEPFDTELKIITAKGNEIWIRFFGKPEMENGVCVRVYGALQDINSKKLEELDYLLTKERFETIYTNSAIGIVLVNTKSQVLMANPASMEIFGFTEADKSMLGSVSYRDSVHPDDLEMASQYRQRLVAGEIPSYTIECRFFRRNGAVIWCRVNTSMVRGKNDSDDLMITQVEDITISKRLEELSTENSNRFISAFEYSPNGMALVGLDGKWLMVNETMSQMLGYERDEFLNLTFQDMTYDEDLSADLLLLNETLENKRTTYSIEKRYIHKNGKLVYGLLNVSLIRDADGNALYFISQINDISKRVHAEQNQQKSLNELEGLLNATTQVAIIQSDINGTIIKYNKGTENLLGYSAFELLGRQKIQIFHIQEEINKRGKELELKYGRPFSGFDIFTYKPRLGKYDAREWTFVRKDGSTFPVHLVITSVLNHKGEIVGYLGIATDISRLKDMESSLTFAKDKAEAASRSKSEFLANMSHEIRTPLNGVIGFSDLLMKTELNDSQKKYMQMVNTSAHSLLDIINDILDFSKIEAGKLELHQEKTDILQLCSQAIDIVKHQAHAKSLEILLNIEPDIKRYIHADPIRLRQILVNLLGNAVKFTVKGEIELKVRSMPCYDSKDEMIFSFSIRDTGIGIAPQNIEKIFNAFDQEDASTTRKYGGTGLGITISNKLLSIMGSSLYVESEVNKGSTFSFRIRFRNEADNADIKKTKVDVKNVLVVDDNANNLVILRDMLAVRNIQTTLVSNGIEALEVLEKDKNFDLAIIDYNMPYLSGTELVKQIRESLNLGSDKLPVMLLHSSIDDEKLIQACIDLDIRFNVTKPIVSDQLFELLNNIHRADVVTEYTESSNLNDGFEAAFKVLIAEDNPVNQMLAKTIIQKIVPNASILLAENGLEAVKAYETQELDVIFMDIQMPEMSGFEATENIRFIEKPGTHIPIVAITARALLGEREECLRLGMDDYITKPINYDALQDVIKKYMVEPFIKKGLSS